MLTATTRPFSGPLDRNADKSDAVSSAITTTSSTPAAGLPQALLDAQSAQRKLHQNADGSLVLRCAGEPPDFTAGLAAIRNLFGADQVLDAELVEDTVVSRKPIMFSAATTPFAK